MLVNPLRTITRQRELLSRQFGVCAVIAQNASDPVQKLFIDKIREYDSKAKATGRKLVDVSPRVEKDLKTELEKVARQYGGSEGTDMTQFPSFQFKDPKVDPINMQ